MNKKILITLLISFALLSTAEAGRRGEMSGEEHTQREPKCPCMTIKGLPEDYREIEALTSILESPDNTSALGDLLPQSMKDLEHESELEMMLNRFIGLYSEDLSGKNYITPTILEEFKQAPQHGANFLWALYPLLKRDDVRTYYFKTKTFRFMSELDYQMALEGMKLMMLCILKRLF